MNPHWIQVIHGAVKEVMKICTYCHKTSVYTPKKIGQFYRCHYCGHKFKEKGK